MTEHVEWRTLYHKHKQRELAVVASYNGEPGHLEKHVGVEQTQIPEWGGGGEPNRRAFLLSQVHGAL